MDSSPKPPRFVPTSEGDSFATRLKQKYGEDADPEVSLQRSDDEAPTGAPSGSSSDLLRRLSDHSLTESRYQLLGEIARGGMGAILKVWDEDLRRTLAMKVILGQDDTHHDDVATTPVDTRTLGRFLEEAQVTAQLDHPGIAPVHELGLDSDGRVYFTMKLVKGRDLKQIFNLVFEDEEGWNETRALSVMLKVCEAMAYAHSKGVIHRDLKPANIMVGSFGEVFVMDWGLAHVIGRKDRHDLRLRPDFASSLTSVRTERHGERDDDADSPLITMDGDIMGTPAYMPPEQARGEIERLSARSDVYAIGAMLYHLLARKLPYVPQGARVSHRMMLLWVLEGPPKRLSELRKEIPAELVAICEKAMSRDAAQRYPNTLSLAEDLRAYLEHRVVSAYETGTWAETKKWIERNRPLAASFAAGVLALGAGLVVMSSLKQRADTNAALAEERRVQAESNERVAKEQEMLAKREKANVLRLSAFQTLDDLTREADALWPAEPGLVPRYRAWLARAQKLVAKIPEFRGALAEIEQRALPQSEDERQAELHGHPRLAELEQRRARRVWLSRMLGEEAWPSEADIEAELTSESLPENARALNNLAWRLVNPEKPVYGSEVKALLMMRRAVALSTSNDRAANRNTLAWALFRSGRLDEALPEAIGALDEAGEAAAAEYEESVVELEANVRRWRSDARAERIKERAAAALDVASLEAEVSRRRAWRFAEEDDQWWHAQMQKLRAGLESFADERTGLMRGVSAQHGWGVARRMDFAATIQERSVSGSDAVRRWSEVIESIAASDKYRGMKSPITPQLGLLPIGEDPDSHLWEFAHLQTGEPARRGADGKLVPAEEMGLVLVLIPGGTFHRGAQHRNQKGPNYDLQARFEESPVHEVRLSPYFLSKYEMTQSQWLRCTGGTPSQYGPASGFSGHRNGWVMNPVEQVSWSECVEVLSRSGLSLPSEAQWENGCRADTSTAWWTGADRESLRGQVNLADRTAWRAGATWPGIDDWPELDDGWVAHAPVGTHSANPHGLHDVHGNVWEWCLDGYHGDFYGRSPELDPVAPIAGTSNRACRGGGFGDAAALARSAHRGNEPAGNQSDSIGLRPARAVER